MGYVEDQQREKDNINFYINSIRRLNKELIDFANAFELVGNKEFAKELKERAGYYEIWIDHLSQSVTNMTYSYIHLNIKEHIALMKSLEKGGKK